MMYVNEFTSARLILVKTFREGMQEKSSEIVMHVHYSTLYIWQCFVIEVK